MELIVFESDTRQVLGLGPLGEQADHELLAGEGGDGRDTRIDLAMVDRDATPAVLWTAAFGDIHARHDLDPRDDQRLHLLG
jgi:hypothetical protein